MKNNTRKIIKWAPTVLIALVITSGACMKLAVAPALADIYSKMGMQSWLQPLGVIELVLLTLFLVPRTMKPGFLLLTAYFGGAMAVELSHGTIFIAPGIILSFIWIAAYLRDASIFRSVERQKKLVTSL
jgi:formate-dependent nitrite reductase membrane component NrfD